MNETCISTQVNNPSITRHSFANNVLACRTRLISNAYVDM